VADLERHAIAVLVDNEPGVLARVIGLFSGRGYNIESLTVAEVDPMARTSRITIVTSGTPEVIEQIEAQLRRARTDSADALLFSVLGAVQDFAATRPLADDMSLVIVRCDSR